MRKTIFIATTFFLLFTMKTQSSEMFSKLEKITQLEKKLSVENNFTFKKPHMYSNISLLQKVSISKCLVNLKTYSKNGLLFRDFYDLSKVKIHRKFKKLNGTYVLGFGLSSLLKARLGLFFNYKDERDYFVKKYKRLADLCHEAKYHIYNLRKKENKKNPPKFIGRIPQGNEETDGKVYDENKNIEIAHLYGEMSFLERYNSIDKAKKSIFIQSLLFRGDEAGKIIGEKLIKRRTEGLDIKVMVDGLASYIFDNTEIKTFKKNSHILFNNMMAAGIRVFGYSCGFAPFKNEVRGLDWGKLTHRNHDKVWLVDSEDPETPDSIGIVGGINFAAEYFRLAGQLKNNWRDHDVLIRGKILTDLRGAFLRLFTEKSFRYRTAKYDEDCLNPYDPLKKRKLYLRFKRKHTKTYLNYSKKEKVFAKISKRRILRLINERISVYNDPAGPTVPFPDFQNVQGSRYIHVRPDEKEDYILKAYHQLIRSATREILIANAYFLPSPEIIKDLHAAAERGVDIRIISNHANSHKLNMINLVGRSYYFDLKQKFPGKIQIFEWTGKKLNERNLSHNTMHSKYMVIDQKVSLVGSHNLDYSSQNNSETAIIFESDVLSEELSDYYNKLKNYSIEPSMEKLYYYKYPKGKDLILLKILKLIEHRL